MYNRWDNPSSLYLIMHVEDCALLSMDPMFHCHSHMRTWCTQALRVPFRLFLSADDYLSLRLPGVNSQYDARNSQSSRAKIARKRLPGVHGRRLPGVHRRSEQPIRWSSMWPDTTTSVLEELRRMVHLWAIHRQTFLKSAKILKSKRLRGHTVEISSSPFARRLYKKLSMSKSHKQRRHFDTRYFEIFWNVAPHVQICCSTRLSKYTYNETTTAGIHLRSAGCWNDVRMHTFCSPGGWNHIQHLGLKLQPGSSRTTVSTSRVHVAAMDMMLTILHRITALV